ncbi:MAG: hypothetical protein J6I66_00890 [Lachnospiraceae bacterium]|nr:hypothetical protein [Lachnospiraceae bacterium]
MSNLYKTSYMNMGSDKRVIDMNELVKKRIDALGYKMQRPENSGFVEGINADSTGVEELVEGVTLESEIFPEGEGGEFTEGLAANVIKAESHADTQALLDAAHMEAERIIDTAKASASKIESDAESKADSILEEARNKGYESGYSEGMTKAAQEMQDMREALDKEKEELEELYQKRLNDMEPELVDTITDVYEHILKTDLKIHKTIAGHLVANALRNIEGARSFFIHISKDNYDYVNSRKGVLEEAVKVPGSIIEIMEDISLPPDSCMIETDGGIFDCSLGTELSELSTKLKMLSYSRDDSNN